jgi:ribosomal protein S18 acetylase RimI-like enzyme
VIVPLAKGHIREVARLHCETLTGLLTELGEPAARSFYAGAVRVSSARGLVDVEGGTVRGFVFGSVRPADLKKEIFRRNPFGTAASVLRGSLRKPAAFRFLLKSFKGPDDGAYDSACAELTYLAVAPDSRKSGAGRRLVDAFSAAMRDARVKSYELSVDDDNAGAIRFYETLGFKLVGRYREFGIAHGRYRLELESVLP